MLDGLMRFLGITPKEDNMYVATTTDGSFIFNHDGTVYAGPYKREKDAKGQLTRLQKSYTPAARRLNKEA